MMLNSLRRLLAGTLRRQLMIGITLVFGLAMSLFVWDQSRRQHTVLSQQQTEQAVVLARTAATSAAVWVASMDYGGMQDIVDSLAHYPDLQYAIILDTRGQIWAHTDQSRRRQYLNDMPKESVAKVFLASGGFSDVASPVMLSGKHIGWVRVGLGAEVLNARLAQASRSGVLYGLLGIVLSCVLALLVSGRMTRRLQSIQDVADAVQRGDTKVRTGLAGDDEAAQLAQQFNNMLDGLAQREDALRDSEAQNLALINAIPDLIFVNDRDGQYLAVHASDPRLLLVPPEEILHRNVQDLLPEPLAQRYRNGFACALDSKEIQFLNYSILLEGREKYFEARIVARTEDTVVSIVRDVTEQRRAEDSQRIAAIAFESQEGMFVADAAGLIVQVNQAFTDITGYTAQEAVGENPRLLKSGRNKSDFYEAMWESISRNGFGRVKYGIAEKAARCSLNG